MMLVINNGVRRLLLMTFCLALLTGFLSAGERPAVHIRPELYLGWSQQQDPPEPEKLPWMLQMTLRAVDDDGRVVAGPLQLNTREEFAGASFTRSELVTSSESDANKAGQAEAFLTGMDFAVQVVPEGANLINLRCFIKVQQAQGEKVETYQTNGMLACRPGRETVLAEFPGFKLLVAAKWRGPAQVE